MEKVVTVNNLAVTLDGQSILRDINCSLAKGEILGLVGPSGCGKTTLLNTLAGFIVQDAGDISIAEQTIINSQNPRPPEKRHIGMIFQDYALFPHLTIEQNILFGIKKMPKDYQQEKLTKLMSLLKLSEYQGRYPHQLSGGQQQRVAIARAIAPQPQLLLLDEPFSNIDARLRHELMVELRLLLKQLKMSAIFVTHNKDEVFTFADKMAVMDSGKILQIGTPTDLCQQPTSWQVADFLQLGSWLPCETNETGITSLLSTFTTNVENQACQDNQQMLIKPQHLALNAQGESNVEVMNISVTEQGFHYQLASIDREHVLAVDELSFYSDQVFSVGTRLSVEVLLHDFLIFGQNPH